MNIEIALKIINGKEIPAVTSLQVAEHFRKNHKDVLRDIRVTIEKCSHEFNERNFAPVEYTDAKGEKRPMYILSKDGFMMVAMGYITPEAMTIKETYIARFNEMEERLRNSIPDLPNFQNPALAARAWAEQYERRQIAETQRDEAIRTKAWISDKKTATAMATASAAVRKAAALENELGRGKRYKSVKAIPWFLDVFADTPAAYSVAGRKLSDMSRRMDYEIREIEDSRFGSVKAYHIDVIESFRLALRNDLNMMRKYRR